jgi:hypothetical protein
MSYTRHVASVEVTPGFWCGLSVALKACGFPEALAADRAARPPLWRGPTSALEELSALPPGPVSVIVLCTEGGIGDHDLGALLNHGLVCGAAPDGETRDALAEALEEQLAKERMH